MVTFNSRQVIDPNGQVHVNPRVNSFSCNLQRKHAPFLFLFAFGCAVACLYTVVKEISLEKNAQYTSATVARFTSRVEVTTTNGHSHSVTMYQRVLSFTDTSGQTHEFQDPASSSWEPQVGEQVPVLYDPNDPSSVRVNSFINRFGFALLFGAFAVVMFGMGVVAFVFNIAPTSYLNIDGQVWRGNNGSAVPYQEINTSTTFSEK